MDDNSIPTGPEARELWGALPRSHRRKILRDARRGIPCADAQTARIAVGWAWAVLGAPGQRRGIDWMELLFGVGRGGPFADPYDGDPDRDALRYVRANARRVEWANVGHLLKMEQ